MITVLTFSSFIKLMTAISITFCIHVDEPNLNYCTEYMMECVLDGEAIEFCGRDYIEGTRKIVFESK